MNMALELKFIVPVIFCVLYFGSFYSESYKITSSEDVLSYLEHFGYLSEENEINEHGSPVDDVHDALKHFQEINHLAPVGEITSKTISAMNIPRCGNRDERLWEGDEIDDGNSETTEPRRQRRKRTIGIKNKWKKKLLTYRIGQFPTASPVKLNSRAVQSEFDSAFKYWEDVSSLRFKKAKAGKNADINIHFLRGSHGDFESFDGPGRTLAHGFYPAKGVVHFDDQERWSIGYKKRHFDIRTVAVHEIGHALGLVHSNTTNAVMFYQYRGHTDKTHDSFHLHPDDISAIQAIYGPNVKKQKSPHVNLDGINHKSTTAKPDLCVDPKINAITTMSDGFTYIFKGDYYFKAQHTPWKTSYPKLIATTFPGLPSDLDAALTMKNKRTYFFKGNEYWRSSGTRMDPGYPKSISANFKHIPSHLDAACIWSWNNETYFFKGREYWKYSENSNLMKGYPKPIAQYWPGIPNSVDAAFMAPDNKTYFFKGPKYWMFHDPNSHDEATSYPQHTTDYWLQCPTNDVRITRKIRHRKRFYH